MSVVQFRLMVRVAQKVLLRLRSEIFTQIETPVASAFSTRTRRAT